MVNADESYIKGRLMGLSQLVSILKDIISSEQPAGGAQVIRSIVLHISDEMDSILEDMKATHGEAIAPISQKNREIKEQIKATPQPSHEEVAKHVEAADTLMKQLVELKAKKPPEQKSQQTTEQKV